jgi:hypothetical protein
MRFQEWLHEVFCMRRRIGCLGVLLLLGSLAGCNLCQSPYDYAGSVMGPDGNPNCQFGSRWGSVFAPTAGSPPAVTSERSPTPATAIEPQDSMSISPEPEPADIELDQPASR